MVSFEILSTAWWGDTVRQVASRHPETRFAAVTGLDSNYSAEHVSWVLRRLTGIVGAGNVYSLADLLALDLNDDEVFPGFDEVWLLSQEAKTIKSWPTALYLVQQGSEGLREIGEWMAANGVVAGVGSGDGVTVFELVD